MMNLLTLLLLSSPVALAAKSLAGFNYGAFWGNPENAKTKQDFLDGFNMAKNLSTDISFNSARLFSCIQAGTENDTTGAFEAAIETQTNLLLGFWITPVERTRSHEALIDDEIEALEKGFQKHGQALADLVLGLSVGNEDIYRFVDTPESGVAADDVAQSIDKVKKRIAASSFAKYMKDKPIGHIDTAQHAVVDNADFIGANAYPYWTNEHIDEAKLSFLATNESVKQKAGNRPVWITEVGWPVKGPQRGDAVASVENLQKYWTEVGCAIFGNYPTFWFELVTDSTPDQPDWGFMNLPSRQPRIKDLKCPTEFPSATPSPLVGSSQEAPSPPAPSLPLPNTLTLSTLPSPSVTPSLSSSSPVRSEASAPAAKPTNANEVTATVTVFTTVQVTAQATVQAAPAITPRSSTSNVPADRPWCVTVADIDSNGQLVTIAGNPAGPNGTCSTPPTYNGYPYASNPSVKPTSVPVRTPWCVTMADIDQNNQLVPVSAGPAGLDGKCISPPGWTWPTGSPSTALKAPSKPVEGAPSTKSSAWAAKSSSAAETSQVAGSSVAPAPALLPASQIIASSPLPALPASQEVTVSSAPAPVSSPVASAQSSSSVHPYCKAKLRRAASLIALSVVTPSILPSPLPVAALPTLSLPSKESIKSEAGPSETSYDRRVEKREWNWLSKLWKKLKFW